MKFTKEQCLESIQAVLGQTKLTSDRSILENLDTLIPLVASDEMELEDFIEKVSPSFKTMESNLRHEQSVFAKDFKEKNTPKPIEPIKPAEPIKPIEQPAPASQFTLEQLTAAIAEANKPLQERLDAIDKEKAIKSLISDVDSIVSTWNINPDRIGSMTLAKEMTFATIKDGISSSELAESLKANYDRVLKASGSDNGYIPKDSTGGDGQKLELKRKLESFSTPSNENGVKTALGLS